MRRLGYGARWAAHALADSPAGQAAWIYEKFHDWTDHRGAVRGSLTG